MQWLALMSPLICLSECIFLSLCHSFSYTLRQLNACSLASHTNHEMIKQDMLHILSAVEVYTLDYSQSLDSYALLAHHNNGDLADIKCNEVATDLQDSQNG